MLIVGIVLILIGWFAGISLLAWLGVVLALIGAVLVLTGGIGGHRMY